MRQWALVASMLITACDPLAGYEVEDRPSVDEAILPMICRDSVGRTSTGIWACQVGNNPGEVVISRGADDSQTLRGSRVAVAGASIWTWDEQAHLAHFEEDPLAPVVLRSPDEEFDWNAMRPFAVPLRSFVARERSIVIATSSLRVIAALPARLEVRSETATSFSASSHFGNTAWALLDRGSFLSGWGPMPNRTTGWAFCDFLLDPADGITLSGRCSEAPRKLVGIASGGMWMSEGRNDDGTDKAIQFYRSTNGVMQKVDGLELPRLDWVEGGVPWVLHPDEQTMLVPRVEGDRLIIDRYKASDGNRWAGANETWVYEVGSKTHVRAR